MSDLDTTIRTNMPSRKRATLNYVLRLSFVAVVALVSSALVGKPQIAAQARANLAALDAQVVGILVNEH